MNEITTYQQSPIISKFGTEEEREYLLRIMAEQLGIPARDAETPQALAVMANAAQRAVEYGWVPGIHMHVQSFTRKAKDGNPEEVVYTLVDGEKAWKDNALRHRHKYGVIWKLQHKRMDKEELAANIMLAGYEDQVPRNAYGVWARVIIKEQDDPEDEFDPMWVAGIWFGKVRVGNFWNVDRLPTGVTSRDVALRRADKRALMACATMPLIPLTDDAPEQRIESLKAELLNSVDPHGDKLLDQPTIIREENGDVLEAK